MQKSERLQKDDIVSNPDEAAIFAAELGGEAPEIDLHELDSIDQAIHRLDAFINHEAVAGTEVIRIIHGHGTGKLRAEVEKYLRSQTELVKRFRGSNKPGEQGAVTYAALERLTKS